MSLKEDLQSDVHVFCDDGEFAELITLDGVTVSAVIEDETASYTGGASGGFADASGLGLMVATKKIYMPDTLPVSPVPEQQVTLYGKEWIVQSVQEELGMIVVTVTAAES